MILNDMNNLQTPCCPLKICPPKLAIIFNVQHDYSKANPNLTDNKQTRDWPLSLILLVRDFTQLNVKNDGQKCF